MCGLECWTCIADDCDKDPAYNYRATKDQCGDGESCQVSLCIGDDCDKDPAYNYRATKDQCGDGESCQVCYRKEYIMEFL